MRKKLRHCGLLTPTDLQNINPFLSNGEPNFTHFLAFYRNSLGAGQWWVGEAMAILDDEEGTQVPLSQCAWEGKYITHAKGIDDILLFGVADIQYREGGYFRLSELASVLSVHRVTPYAPQTWEEVLEGVAS